MNFKELLVWQKGMDISDIRFEKFDVRSKTHINLKSPISNHKSQIDERKEFKFN